MIARRIVVAAACTAGLAWVPPAQAAGCAGLPAHGTSPVVDTAGVIENTAERTFASVLESQRRAAGAAIVVHTVTSLGGRSIESYAYDVFACWGIGARQRNDGVLIVLAMRDRKLRIEVGAGLRDRFTDEEAAAVIDRMAPLLRSGDVTGALATGIALTAAEVAAAAVPTAVPVPDEPQDVTDEPAVGLPGGFPSLPDGSPVDFPGPPGVFPLFFLAAATIGGLALLSRLFGTGGVKPRQVGGWDNVPFLTGAGRPGMPLPGFDSATPFADPGPSSSGSSYGGGSSGGGASGSW